MRKLKLQMQLSVDGYVADINGKTDWMIWGWGPEWTWDTELRKEFNRLKSTVDTVLLSRKMAEEGFIAHWAAVATDTKSPQYTFAKKITDAAKIVFTKTRSASVWENTTLAKGELAQEVNKLKMQPGEDIIVYGGASFVSSLIRENLIDEFYFYINPIVLGTGISIFKNVGDKHHLSLITAKSFECGIAVLHYALK